MYYSDKVDLIAVAGALDKLGNFSAVETARTVYADVRSVSRAEFRAAGANGLKPALTIAVHACDYRSERLLVYQGERYAVYREFRKGEGVELYMERRKGDAGERKDQC